MAHNREHLTFSISFLWSKYQIVFQSLSHVQFFVTPWTAARHTSLSITISRSLLKFMFIESVMSSNHLIPCQPSSSYLLSVPESGSFPMGWFFSSDGSSIGASPSASFLPMTIQGWFPLVLTGLIFLQFKGLSRVFSSITIWKHPFFSVQSSLWFNAHIHTWLLEKP